MVLWVSGRVLRSTHPGNMQWVCAYSSGKTGARPRSLAPKLSLALLYLNFHWTFLPIMTNGNHHIAHWGACYCGAARSYFHARDQCSFRDYGQLSLCCSRWQGKVSSSKQWDGGEEFDCFYHLLNIQQSSIEGNFNLLTRHPSRGLRGTHTSLFTL